MLDVACQTKESFFDRSVRPLSEMARGSSKPCTKSHNANKLQDSVWFGSWGLVRNTIQLQVVLQHLCSNQVCGLLMAAVQFISCFTVSFSKFLMCSDAQCVLSATHRKRNDRTNDPGDAAVGPDEPMSGDELRIFTVFNFYN